MRTRCRTGGPTGSPSGPLPPYRWSTPASQNRGRKEAKLNDGSSPKEEDKEDLQVTWPTLSWLNWAAKAFSMSASKASRHICTGKGGDRALVAR